MRLVRSLDFRGWALLGAAALCIALPGVIAALGGSAHAGVTLEERKLPMRFSWVACQPDCRGWVSAVGIVTADSPKDFDEFARGRQLAGATIVLDSSGGSVNDSIALGRRWRNLGALTTVGISVQTHTAQGDRASVVPEAYCESMCVFLLLSGKTRYVPEAAHVRVHQIWMGDRADDAKAASYSAQDLMIVERDIGRLAKYTFDMGGAGDLLSLSLSVPPWEDLHELSRGGIAADQSRHHRCRRRGAAAEPTASLTPVAALPAKPVQDRFVSSAVRTPAPIAQPRNRPRRPKPWFRPAASRPRSSDCVPGSSRGAARIVARRGYRSSRARPLRMTKLSRRLRCRLLGLGFDLADRIDHGIEGQHGRGMPRLVVAHRLEQRDIGPFALRRAAVFLQHLADGFAQFAQFARGRADDVARHDRGRGLAERAGLHVMGKIGDDRPVHFEVDLDGRAAQFGMRGGAGVGGGQPAKPGDIAGQFDDALVVDVVQHKIEVSGWPIALRSPLAAAVQQPYIWVANGGNTVRPFLGGPKWKPIRPPWC